MSIATREQEVVEAVEKRLYIGGEWRDASGGGTLEVEDPATAEILWRAFELLNRRADDLALLMTLEMGKAIAESKAEIAYAAEFFRWFSGEALRIDGYWKVAGNAASRVLVMRQ